MQRLEKSDERGCFRGTQILSIGRHVAATLNDLPDKLVLRETQGHAVEGGPSLSATFSQRVTVTALFNLEYQSSLPLQAISMAHSRAAELGDGPAFALTYGVSSIPAALLCQMGFPSRVGAMWVTRQLSSVFTDMDGLRDWLRQNNALLSDPDFWESDDLYKLWTQVSSPANVEHPRGWSHANYTVGVNWKLNKPLAANNQVRIIAGNDRSGTICTTDLTPLGVAQFTFDPQGAALNGSVTADGKVIISYFGR